VDLYVLIQWADTDTFGASPGDPGQITGSTNDGVGMQLAWMLNGSSPWMGTTDTNGADTKGTPVWHPDAMVLPAPNNRVGEFDTNREYCAGFIDCAGQYNSVYGMIGNPDFFVWYCDVRNDQLYLRTKFWSCVDVIAPISGTVSASCPIAMSFCGNMNDASTAGSPFASGGGFSSDVSDSLISIGTNHDGISNSSNTADGGAFTCNPGVNGTSSFRFSTFPVFKLSEQFPNKNVEPTINSDVAWDLLPLYVYNVDDAWGGLGTLPYIYCSTSMLPMYSPITSTVYNSPICQCQISTRYTSNLYGAFVIPWIGPAPRSQLSTEGVTFT